MVLLLQIESATKILLLDRLFHGLFTSHIKLHSGGLFIKHNKNNQSIQPNGDGSTGKCSIWMDFSLL